MPAFDFCFHLALSLDPTINRSTFHVVVVVVVVLYDRNIYTASTTSRTTSYTHCIMAAANHHVLTCGHDAKMHYWEKSLSVSKKQYKKVLYKIIKG